MKILRFSLSLIAMVAVLFLGLKILDRFEQKAVEKHSQNAIETRFHQNPDVFAWLTVEGTRIDYPVAQHPRDDTYYLSHDIDGKETYYGAIFTELVNKITFEDPVTIIYGHAMLDDSMFGSLDYFAKPAFFKEHERITIDTLTQHLVKVRQSLPMEMAIKPYILTMSNIAQLAFAMQMELVSQKRMMKTTVCQA